MNTTGWIWALVAVVIIALGAWWYISSNNTAAPATTGTEQGAGTVLTGSEGGTASSTGPSNQGSDQGMADTGVTGSVGVGVATPKTVTINYTASGFSPAKVTVNKGDTVKFVNQTSGNMWVASDEHPSHTEFDGTSRSTHCAAGYSGPTPFDQCGSGSSYSFAFTKAGSFAFHNHAAAQFGGTVVVQ